MSPTARHGDLLQNQFRISTPFYEEICENGCKQLPKLKRIMLLSRGDLVGKAFANGVESLTEEERNMLLQRPPPELRDQNIKQVSGGAISTLAEFIAADLSVVPDTMLSFVFAWMFWTRSTEHLQVGFFEDMENQYRGYYHSDPYGMARHWVWKSDKDDFDFLLRVSDESARRQEIPADQRPPKSRSDPVVDADPPPEEIIEEQQAAVRAAYLVHKERTRAETEAQLAEILKSLTDEEPAELERLLHVERDTVAKEDEKAALQEVAQGEEHRQRMAQFDREDVERKEKIRKRKRNQTLMSAKRKRLGIEEDEEDNEDEEDDDGDEFDD